MKYILQIKKISADAALLSRFYFQKIVYFNINYNRFTLQLIYLYL